MPKVTSLVGAHQQFQGLPSPEQDRPGNISALLGLRLSLFAALPTLWRVQTQQSPGIARATD